MAKGVTDEQLRILADRARGEEGRRTGFFFNQMAWTASLRAVYDLGVKHGSERVDA